MVSVQKHYLSKKIGIKNFMLYDSIYIFGTGKTIEIENRSLIEKK